MKVLIFITFNFFTLSLFGLEPPCETHLDQGSEQARQFQTTSQSYQVKELISDYVGEETVAYFKETGKQVVYLNKVERVKYEIFFNSEGKMIDYKGRIVTTDDAIFIMDKHGNIYLNENYKRGYFHHSSFLSGALESAASLST